MERRWKLFKTAVRNSELLIEANGIRLDMLRTGIDFGKSIGVVVLHDPEWSKYVDVSRKAVNRYKRLIDAVDAEELALQFSKNDIDIMAPPGTTDDEIAEYQQLGFIVAASLGYLLVVSVVYATTTYLIEKNEELANSANNRNYKLDMDFGTHKDPKVRQRWKQLKKDKDFQPKKSVIKSLMDGIQDLGDFVTKKAGMGLVIAIPVIAALLLLRGRK